MATPVFAAQTPEDANALTRMFIGEKSGYYLAKWQKQSSWNWAAFFFGFGWMAYRKMYTYCFIFLGALLAVTFLEVVFDWPESVSRAITIGFGVTAGSQGNLFYKAHVERKLRQISPAGQLDDEGLPRLLKEGGTSWGAAIGLVLAGGAVLFLSVIILLSVVGSSAAGH